MYGPDMDAERRIEWLQVETPDGVFAWARGPQHTAADAAEAAGRRYWRGADTSSCAVLDRTGRCLRHNKVAFIAAAMIYVGRPAHA